MQELLLQVVPDGDANTRTDTRLCCSLDAVTCIVAIEEQTEIQNFEIIERSSVVIMLIM